jgi:protein-tyrosine phosphatase
VAAAQARALVFRLSSRWYGPDPANAKPTWLGQERIAIGAVPTVASVPDLSRQGVTHVVNCRTWTQVLMSQDLEVERMTFGPGRVVHAPMRDLGFAQHPRRWAAAACFAADALDSDPEARVLIHCQQGRRRSAMIAYSVLRLRGHTAQAAAALILQHRTQAELVPAYVRSVEEWLGSDHAVDHRQ